MTISSLFFKVRDRMVEWGWVERPRFYLQRHAAGETRDRLSRRGTRTWRRRTALRRLVEV